MSLEQNYTAILGQLGEDVSREGLLDTPHQPPGHSVMQPHSHSAAALRLQFNTPRTTPHRQG